MLKVVHCFAIAVCTFALITSSPINEQRVYTLNDKPSHPSERLTNNDPILNLAEDTNVSHVPNDETIPLIVFEASSSGNRTDGLDDCSGSSYNTDCTSDHELDVDLVDSNEYESSVVQQTEPSDQIQLRTSNGDADTVFFISNTEVKMLDINPTAQRETAAAAAASSIYENFAIEVPENFTVPEHVVAEVLKEERVGNFINTPIVHFINKMKRHNFSAVEPRDERPNITMQEAYGNITTLTVIDEAAGENIFTGLSDIQTVTVAGLMTIVPLILASIFVIAVGFGCRMLWQKYKREYDSGSVLLGECNSEIQPAKLLDQGGQERKMSNNTLEETISNKLETGEEKGIYRNGSIIKMTMQNNHLIVETEERSDISTDTRETRLHYSSEKDGIFVVEATCGANQMNGSINNKKTNNLIKASQQSVLESNLKLNNIDGDDVQVHSPPNTPPQPKTGLSQSTQSLHSSSTDSNHNYQYGGTRYYQVCEEFLHRKFEPMELVMAAAGTTGSRTQSSDTVNSCSSVVSYDRPTSSDHACSNLVAIAVDEK